MQLIADGGRRAPASKQARGRCGTHGEGCPAPGGYVPPVEDFDQRRRTPSAAAIAWATKKALGSAAGEACAPEPGVPRRRSRNPELDERPVGADTSHAKLLPPTDSGRCS